MTNTAYYPLLHVLITLEVEARLTIYPTGQKHRLTDGNYDAKKTTQSTK